MTAMILLAFTVGLTPPGVAGINYLLMLLVAVSVVPKPEGTASVVVVCATSIVLGIVGWLQAADNDAVGRWVGILRGGAP